mgnify:CR=1 FL=1
MLQFINKNMEFIGLIYIILAVFTTAAMIYMIPSSIVLWAIYVVFMIPGLIFCITN